MKRLSKTAKVLSILLNIFSWLALLSGLVLGFSSLLGFITLLRNAGGSDPHNTVLTVHGIMLDFVEIYSETGIVIDARAELPMRLLTLAVCFLQIPLTCYGMQLLRKVLLPMVQQRPFNGTSKILAKLGWVSLAVAFVENATDWGMYYYMEHGYRLSELFLGGPITRVTIHHETDYSFVILAVVVFILSGVFRYGEELQQLSDETL